MCFGKRWSAEQHFRSLLSNNPTYENGCGIKKCYIALVQGVPSRNEGIVEGLIRKCYNNYKRFSIYPSKNAKRLTEETSKFVKTEFQLVDTVEHGTFGNVSLICFTLTTGRRHQIRATASSLGCPIIGDELYGGPKYGALMLHSLFMGFEGVKDTDLLYGDKN